MVPQRNFLPTSKIVTIYWVLNKRVVCRVNVIQLTHIYF